MMQGTASFWRKTPPALFPPILGLVGLALAWRRTAEMFEFGGAFAAVISFVVFGIFLLAVVLYGAKLFCRPAVILEDLRTVPGRLGLSAAMLSGMLLASMIVPLEPALASIMLYAFFSGHVVLLILVVRVLAGLPQAERQVTPAWHLSFVGFIALPFAGIELGHLTLSVAVFFSTVIIALLIYSLSVDQLKQDTPPPPARPFLAIHLAPLSLFGTAAYLLNLGSLSVIMAGLASLVFLALLVNLGWLTAAGFSPAWSAFTFPLAAYAAFLLTLASLAQWLGWVGLALLAIATVFIPFVFGRIAVLWIRGQLRGMTGAAVA